MVTFQTTKHILKQGSALMLMKIDPCFCIVNCKLISQLLRPVPASVREESEVFLTKTSICKLFNFIFRHRSEKRAWYGGVKLCLAEKLENALWHLICLSQHRCCSLVKNVVLGERHHFFSHVDVSNTRFSGS